ncbi:DUF4838 domain-containing protein [Mesonia aestuariivivens]|uniref:DUF4838 domain-containing protein n=1 Tax=Mesonia aestuariivivens TaxID=2796128 RepID=A0ABS6W5R7_9FLAO|nr:DUF4838 domain-containing protein [Mesonia aestuariivivens]MBW2962867.1 DUF4838 domain-containing protein [Mesonia aestuariivivens]
MKVKLQYQKWLLLQLIILLSTPNFSQTESSFSYRESYFPMLSTNKHFQLKYHTMPLDNYWGLWGHNLIKWLKDEDHEEIYAFINHKRNHDQLCFSSENLKKIIKTRIDSLKESYQYFMIAPLDNTLACQCTKCLKAGNTKNNAAPAVFKLLNELALQNPNINFYTTAYLSVNEPPKQKQPNNIGLFFSTINFQRGKAYNELNDKHTLLENLKKWQININHLLVWEYTLNYDNFLDFYPNLLVLQENLKFLKNNGVTGVFINGSETYSVLQEIKCATTARLLYNVNLDVDEILKEEFLKRFPTEVAELSYQFYSKINHEFSDSKYTMGIYTGMNDAYHKYLNPALLNTFYKDLNTLTKKHQDQQTKSLLMSVCFLKLELMRYFGVEKYGYAETINKTLLIKPEVAKLLYQLETLSHQTGVTIYNEQGFKISEYIEFWKKEIKNYNKTKNLFLNKDFEVLSQLDHDYKNKKTLNNGSFGFLDYNNNWLINSIDDLEICVNANDLEDNLYEIKLSFLNDPQHHIYFPSEVILSNAEKVLKAIQIKKSIIKEKKAISISLDQKKYDLLNIKILRSEDNHQKRQMACDQIIIN